MAISMLPATQNLLGNNAEKCESRSLFHDRFADPLAKEDQRKAWFQALFTKNTENIQFFAWLPDSAAVLHARLMSRLMVDLANGVMENANVNLNRYGLPRIPGSAVKGLARRMALQALHDWIAAGTERPAEDDICAPCCANFTSPAEMLAAIARVFGWTPDDWKTDKKFDKITKKQTTYQSDFAWACSGGLDQQRTENLRNHLSHARTLLPAHETFSGTIAFLEATPNTDPGLELDVLTPHHNKYYEGKDPAYATAPDTEDTVPVFFPAIKPQLPGSCFTFSLIPLRLAAAGDLNNAKTWLAHGLELLGIGAKTHAGYGFFQVIENQYAAFPERFTPKLHPAEKFINDWGAKIINSMNIRIFCKEVVDFDALTLRTVFDSIAPGKTADFKDPFWNPFKTDPNGKAILEKIRSIP